LWWDWKLARTASAPAKRGRGVEWRGGWGCAELRLLAGAQQEDVEFGLDLAGEIVGGVGLP